MEESLRTTKTNSRSWRRW